MRRVTFGLAAACGFVVAAGGCDPDLTVRKVPGDSGSDAPAPPAVLDAGDATTSPPNDAATETDGQTDAQVEDSGPTGHLIDGNNDFQSTETFTTSSSTYTAYIAWDAESIYFGMTGEDIGKPASEQRWVLVYFGAGGSGTTTGIDYNGGGNADSQQPTLPFSSDVHVRLKSDLSYVNGQSFSGSAWVPASSVIPDCEKKGTFVECRVARSSLGNPTALKMHISMVKEVDNAEWTYAGVPQSSFTDGKDPNYGKYFEFDLADLSTAPNSYSAK